MGQSRTRTRRRTRTIRRTRGRKVNPLLSAATKNDPTPAKEFISLIPVVGFILNHGYSGVLTVLATGYLWRRGHFCTCFSWPPLYCAIPRGVAYCRQRELFSGGR